MFSKRAVLLGIILISALVLTGCKPTPEECLRIRDGIAKIEKALKDYKNKIKEQRWEDLPKGDPHLRSFQDELERELGDAAKDKSPNDIANLLEDLKNKEKDCPRIKPVAPVKSEQPKTPEAPQIETPTAANTTPPAGTSSSSGAPSNAGSAPAEEPAAPQQSWITQQLGGGEEAGNGTSAAPEPGAGTSSSEEKKAVGTGAAGGESPDASGAGNKAGAGGGAAEEEGDCGHWEVRLKEQLNYSVVQAGRIVRPIGGRANEALEGEQGIEAAKQRCKQNLFDLLASKSKQKTIECKKGCVADDTNLANIVDDQNNVVFNTSRLPIISCTLKPKKITGPCKKGQVVPPKEEPKEPPEKPELPKKVESGEKGEGGAGGGTGEGGGVTPAKGCKNWTFTSNKPYTDEQIRSGEGKDKLTGEQVNFKNLKLKEVVDRCQAKIEIKAVNDKEKIRKAAKCPEKECNPGPAGEVTISKIQSANSPGSGYIVFPEPREKYPTALEDKKAEENWGLGKTNHLLTCSATYKFEGPCEKKLEKQADKELGRKKIKIECEEKTKETKAKKGETGGSISSKKTTETETKKPEEQEKIKEPIKPVEPIEEQKKTEELITFSGSFNVVSGKESDKDGPFEVKKYEITVSASKPFLTEQYKATINLDGAYMIKVDGMPSKGEILREVVNFPLGAAGKTTQATVYVMPGGQDKEALNFQIIESKTGKTISSFNVSGGPSLRELGE